jgi:hypothetical protein
MHPFRATLAAVLAASVMTLAHAQALRPEVAKPLAAAGDLLKAGKAKEALAKVREADAVGGKNGNEQYMVDRMRGAAAQRAGDLGTAIRSFESVYTGGRDQAQMAEQLAFAYSQLKDWGKTREWIGKAQAAGGGSAQLRQLQAYLQSQSGDYGAIAREALAEVSAAEQAGRRPEEADLLRLADAQARGNNAAGQTATLEKLLAYYPKKDYWSIYLGRLQRKSGFSDRFALDVMRLKLATGNLGKTEEFMEMSQLALQAGLAAEGKAIVDKGFASNLLGQGAEAARHQRLRDLAVKQDTQARASIEQRAKDAASAKDGNALVQVGYELATLSQAERGVGLIEQGIAKGGLKRPEDAKLRLGQAMLQSPKHKAKAAQVLRSVQGTDGAADLGRLWTMVGNGG